VILELCQIWQQLLPETRLVNMRILLLSLLVAAASAVCRARADDVTDQIHEALTA